MQNKILDNILFEKNDIDSPFIISTVENSLNGSDDGELFIEVVKNENLSFDDGKLKIASSDYSSGFGLRSVIDEKVGYAHSSEISKSSLNRAADTIKSFKSNSNKVLEISPNYSNKKYYTDINPISETPFSKKIEILKNIDSYARSLSSNVEQVSVGLSSNWQGI